MSQSQRDLREQTEELSATLRELRDELRAPRGPFGLPRPPTPGELLRFTEAYAIPTAIAVLEANIRALELLAATIRLVEGGSADTEVRDRAAAASRATLDRLDDALADLQSAVEGGEPANPEVRRLLEQARDLRAEIDARLREAAEGGERVDATDRPRGLGERHEVPVDVEAELESIKRELDGPGADRGDAGAGDDGDADDSGAGDGGGDGASG